MKDENKNLIEKDNQEIKNDKQPKTGSYKMHLDSKIDDTATDIYYKTECKLEDSKVSIPTKDAVKEAKEWVDDENKM